MPDTPRTAGLRGRKPAAFPPELQPVGAYLVAPLPAPVYPIDVTGGVPADELGMLGNGPDSTLTITTPNGPGQPVGDCWFAGVVHKKRVDAAMGKESTDVLPDSNATVGAYDVYDHDVDEGVEMAAAMLAWFRDGFPGPDGTLVIDKCEAFARIEPDDVDAAMVVFGAVLCGVNLTDDADQLFESGQPWTVADGQQPNPDDGHVVLRVRATADTDTYVSWGGYQDATKEWSAVCVEEAWAPVTTEMAMNAMLVIKALLADIRKIGGSSIPDPVAPPAPAPPPGPAPGPSPTPAPMSTVDRIEHDAEAVVHDAEQLAEDAVHAVESV